MECELCCFTALATLYFIIESNATKNIVRRKDLTGSLTFIAVMESDFPHMQKNGSDLQLAANHPIFHLEAYSQPRKLFD